MRAEWVFLSVTLACAAVSACDNEPGKGKTAAGVSAAVTAPAAPTMGDTRGKRFVFSNADSKLEWTAAKVTRKHDGSFQEFQGTIDLVDKDPTKSSVAVEIGIASVFTDVEHLMSHLKTPDLLDAAQFPKAHFQSTQIVAGGDNGASHTVTGNFELHGVSKSIRFPATLTVADSAVDVAAEFVIKRQDFGIVYPGAPDDLIKDDVLIKLHIHAKPGA
jgi:polyisoprenoid-binding protein YceI